MESITGTAAALKDRIIGSVSQQSQSGEEPVSGSTGAGTADEPYDQGNKEVSTTTATESKASGTEPVAGEQGSGTADDPHDKGNKPEQTSEKADMATKPTSIDLPDPSVEPRGSEGATSPLVNKGSGLAVLSKSTSKTYEDPATGLVTETPVGEEPERGRSATTSSTQQEAKPDSKEEPKEKWPVKEGLRTERSISPGTLADGSHAETSGDRGESYAPGKMDKIKGRFGIGKR